MVIAGDGEPLEEYLYEGRLNRGDKGETVKQEDKGRRLRAILALGSQDIADASDLIPLEEGISVVGCSSDHTIVDVTDARPLKSGDVLHCRVRYANMLYAFTGDHVEICYQKDE